MAPSVGGDSVGPSASKSMKASPAPLVRLLHEGDAAAFRTVRLRALREDGGPFMTSYEEDQARPVAEFAARLAASSPGTGVVGAFRGDTLIGTIGFSRHGAAKARHRVLLWGMYVAPEERRHSVGRALILQAVAILRGVEDVEQVEVHVFTREEAARSLYVTVGFQWQGTLRHAMKVGKEYFDEDTLVLPMARQTAGPSFPLPEGLTAPEDDGAARNLAGVRLPDVVLSSTVGGGVRLASLQGRTVVYVYPRTALPGETVADELERHPGGLRVQLRVVRVPRSRRGPRLRRRARHRSLGAAHGGAEGGGQAPAAAVPPAERPGPAPRQGHRPSHLRARGQDVPAPPHPRRRPGEDRACLLPGVPAGPSPRGSAGVAARALRPVLLIAASVLACSCGGGKAADAPDASGDDAGETEASVDAGGADAGADVDKSAPCVSTFGSALTAAFGRVDGTVVAVLPPNDQKCAAPNSTHMILEVMMGGAVYRMVVDVLSTSGSPDVLIDEIDAPLADGAWADGWHPGVQLDYVTTLGVHSPSFTPMHQADLVAKITWEIDLGAHISVFATSGGAASEPDSAHLVHRNLTNADGAIVIHPEAALPHYILLSFGEQTF